MKIWACALLACGIALSRPVLADNCNASANAPANQTGSTSPSCNLNAAVRVLPQDGQGNDVGPSHPLAVTTAGSSAVPAVVGGAGASSLVAKASAGILYGAYITTGATPGWLYIFNATTVPSNGTVTAGTASGNYQDCLQVQASSTLSISYAGNPEPFTTGIVAVFSSTVCGTLTATASGGAIHASAQ